MASRVTLLALLLLGRASANQRCKVGDGSEPECLLESESDIGALVQRPPVRTGKSTAKARPKKPHILLILADDAGYNDAGFRQNKASPVNPDGLPTIGVAVKTPNIDRLAAESLVLQKYYTHSTCSPSRAALLTGRYPFRTGMGPFPIQKGMPYGLPGGETMLAEVLSDAGYATHMVGKWHMGEGDKRWSPTFRGFESFQGYLSGSQSYFEHTKDGGLDFINTTLNSKYMLPNNTNAFQGQYSSEVFTDRAARIVDNHIRTESSRPLFLYVAFQNIHAADIAAPQKYLQMYTGPQFEGRDGRRIQMALAMNTAMDHAVGSIEAIFKQADIWKDTILIFSGDNGGNPSGGNRLARMMAKTGNDWPGGGNYPLRGYKTYDWEGGIRGLAFVRGSAEWRIKPGETNELIHITDFFPTLAHVAGASLDSSIKLDGNNIWDVLSSGAPASRTTIIHDCPWKEKNESAIEAARLPGRAGVVRKGSLKFMVASDAKMSITRPVGQSRQLGFTDDSLMCPPADPIDGKYLFDTDADPRECTNLAGHGGYKDELKELEEMLEACSEEAVPALSSFFRGEGKPYFEANKEHVLVWDEDLKMQVWTEWDCGAKFPGKCGWPLR